MPPERRHEAHRERAFVDTLLAALFENARAQTEVDGKRGPVWETPWQDLDPMRFKLHELGDSLKKYGSHGLASLICELSLVIWQLRAWFTIGAGLLVIEVLKRISEMAHRLPSPDGLDPGLAALRVIEGFILFCAARHKRMRKDAVAALERILLKKRLPPCTTVRIESALVSVGWQKITQPLLSDMAGEDWLNELAVALMPNAEAEAKMERTREMFEGVVQNLFPGARCDYFGSAVNGFETRLSDIDAVVVFSKEDMEQLSNGHGRLTSAASSPALKAASPSLKGMALSRRLQKESAAIAVRMMGEALVANEDWGFEVKEMVTEARVPVLKCTSTEGVAIDITFNNLLPLYNSKLLKAYASFDDRVARLGRLVKFWAKSRMVNDALEGTLSSYSHCLLLIHFLQSIALLPNLQDKEDSGIPDEERAKLGETELFEGVHDVWFLDPGRLPQNSDRWKEWASKSPAGATLRGLLANFFWYLAYEVPAHSDVLSIRLPSRIHKEVYFTDMLMRKQALGQDPVEPALEPLDHAGVADACEDGHLGEEKEPEPEEPEEHEEHEDDDGEDLLEAEVTSEEPWKDLAQKYKLTAEQQELQQAMSTRQTLCIDDPMELGRSLGASFQGFERLCYEWRRAHYLLSEGNSGNGDDIQRLKELFRDRPPPPRSIYNLEKQREFPHLIERAERDKRPKGSGSHGSHGSRSWYGSSHGERHGKGEPKMSSWTQGIAQGLAQGTQGGVQAMQTMQGVTQGVQGVTQGGWPTPKMPNVPFESPYARRAQKGSPPSRWAQAQVAQTDFGRASAKEGDVKGKEGKEGKEAKGIKGHAEGKGLWQ
ncbi:URT1 [Symbiodinium natans]|uniref:URT1 protein n=1 Tax=Symbiodinium natans TaxID=878477 RepID=A0A812HGJ0_9DINO|nr:URT1 [Symbiodinium natans]